MSIKIENDSQNRRHILFSEVYDLGPIHLFYKGNISKSPMQITFYAAKGEVYNPVLYNSTSPDHDHLMIDTSKLADGKMLEGDKIIINTEKGNKSCTLIRGANKTNILDAISDDSVWLTIEPGDNYFNFDSRSGDIDTHLNLQVTIDANDYYIGA